MRGWTAIGVGFFGATLLLFSAIFLSTPLATIFSVAATYWVLRSEAVHGRTALAVSVLYVCVWLLYSVLGLVPTYISTLEIWAFLSFGIGGVTYIAVEGLVARIVSSLRSSARGSRFGRVVSSLLGAGSVLFIANRFRQLVSIRTYAAIALVPAVVLNILLRRIELGYFGHQLADVMGAASIGFVLGFAFVMDSVHHAVSGVRELRNDGDSGDGESVRITGRTLQQMSDEEFRHFLEQIAANAHREARWLSEDTNGYQFIFAESETSTELIVGKRGRTIPKEAEEFGVELGENVGAAIDYLNTDPDQVTIVTDIQLNSRLTDLLEEHGAQVLDAAWFEERFSESD